MPLRLPPRPPPLPSNNLGKIGMSWAEKLEALTVCSEYSQSPGLPVQTQELEFPAVLAGGELRVSFDFK